MQKEISSSYPCFCYTLSVPPRPGLLQLALNDCSHLYFIGSPKNFCFCEATSTMMRWKTTESTAESHSIWQITRAFCCPRAPDLGFSHVVPAHLLPQGDCYFFLFFLKELTLLLFKQLYNIFSSLTYVLPLHACLNGFQKTQPPVKHEFLMI